jgi:hypothetical protein
MFSLPKKIFEPGNRNAGAAECVESLPTICQMLMPVNDFDFQVKMIKASKFDYIMIIYLLYSQYIV